MLNISSVGTLTYLLVNWISALKLFFNAETNTYKNRFKCKNSLRQVPTSDLFHIQKDILHARKKISL